MGSVVTEALQQTQDNRKARARSHDPAHVLQGKRRPGSISCCNAAAETLFKAIGSLGQPLFACGFWL